jgi:hypothetical protein
MPAVLPLLWYRKLRYGYPFRRIPLSQGKYAIVDPDDYEALSRDKWYAAKGHNTFYAVRGKWAKNRKKRTEIRMHRLIMKPPRNMFVDHINHNGLDNRKANLRLATYSQNVHNRKKFAKRASSKYKGVSWHKSIKQWTAAIQIDGRRLHLGCFHNEKDAAKEYDNAAKKYHGEFAILNFPD